MSINYNDQGEAISISFGNIDFEIISNAGRGDCFLLAILQYLRINEIDPFLGTGNRPVNEAQYREFLFQRLLNLLNRDVYNNRDGFVELNYDGNITKINDFLWKKLRAKLRKDMAAKRVDICNPGKYIGELMFQLIVVLYKKIKNIYVYHISEKAGRTEAFKVWTRYFIDKEPRKNYAVVKAKKMENNFIATKESSMFILFRSNPGDNGTNHFELMSPLLNNFTVNVPRENSSGSDTVNLTDEDDNESSITMTNDAILTDIIRQAKNPDLSIIQLTEGPDTCLGRAGYGIPKNKSTGYEQEDAMEAFNRLAERGEFYENPNNSGIYLEKGSDILKSFYARQFKTTKCTNPDNGFERKETPRDERLTISFETEINPLSTYVEQQLEILRTPNRWKYDYQNSQECDAIQTLRYEFYDYILIQLKIFNNTKKLKFTEDEQKTLIGDGTLYLPTVDDIEYQKFQLIGSINHRGKTQNSGHYVAYVKKQTGWYLCNDDIITEYNTDYPYSGEFQPYILFYKRRRIALDNRKPKGIENEGNSCYVNALLQNIINVPELFIRGQLLSSATSSGSRSATSSGSNSRFISRSNSRFISRSRSKKSNKRAKNLNELADVRKQQHEKWKDQKELSNMFKERAKDITRDAEIKNLRDELNNLEVAKRLGENDPNLLPRIKQIKLQIKNLTDNMDVDDPNTESDDDKPLKQQHEKWKNPKELSNMFKERAKDITRDAEINNLQDELNNLEVAKRLGVNDPKLLPRIKQIKLQIKNLTDNMDVDDPNTESDDDKPLDDESKDEDNNVGNTQRSKKMRMDSDYDPFYEDECQRLLYVAKREYERLKNKGRLEGRTLQDFIKSKGNRCGFDEKYIQGTIEKSQKRSLISLSRMTL